MTVRRWLASTPRRTFVLYPVCVVLLELLLRRGALVLDPFGLPLLIWGYVQYRWSGIYRTQHGGGGPGIDIPPTRIVDTGIYAYVRNPMYLGHLIFMTGLAVTFHSLAAVALLIFHLWWFQQRVLEDEQHMTALFGGSFAGYVRRVRRWGVI
ncbi:methyltransferase [Roseiarcaceae bacterium H3SJ34-1]|uniref:methyltransferase family protein n=1 Tax=Terripilifer ovatus TaxID=3032367 RepID=UPI003AB96BE5|nr:methyltransferase [Roseiarcaceae bacterium H3SJ34-1]